jgi:hypothetical protein
VVIDAGAGRRVDRGPPAELGETDLLLLERQSVASGSSWPGPTGGDRDALGWVARVSFTGERGHEL